MSEHPAAGAAVMSGLEALRRDLVAWLVEAACPLWARRGIDRPGGGFVEAIAQDGSVPRMARRARVPPRQIHAFVQSAALGWTGDVAGIVRQGMSSFTAAFRRSDGFFRALSGADGTPLDERVLLYDQAFALLGFAAAARVLESTAPLERRAVALRSAIERRWAAADHAFLAGDDGGHARESNPHLHLLEACLAWVQIGNDAGWTAWTAELLALAVTRFVHRGSGALAESFTWDWRPAPGAAGRRVEPGHQFEWAWLMLRGQRYCRAPLRAAALRMIDFGERHGVAAGYAVNALRDDGSVLEADARLWPQAERLKAALFAAEATGEASYWSTALAAGRSLSRYLETPLRGLWFDVRKPDGSLGGDPAPASSFYHLAGAIAALDTALAAATRGPGGRSSCER